MSNIDTLLDNEINGVTDLENKVTLDVNEPSRTITNSGTVLLGVEGDDKAERIYFKIPKYIFMDENVDLSSNNIEISIIYTNATNNTYIHECTEKSTVTETTEEGTKDFVIFSWVLSTAVTEAAGVVKFVVWVKNKVVGEDGVETIQNEWHSTTYEGTVLKGIPVTNKTPEEISNPTTTAYLLTVKVDEAVSTANSAMAYVNEAIGLVNEIYREFENKADKSDLDAKANKSDLDAKADETLVHEAISNVVGPINTQLETINNDLYDDEGIVPQTVMQVTYLSDQERIKSQFKLAKRFTNVTSVDLTSYTGAYNELMVVVRVETGGSAGTTKLTFKHGGPYAEESLNVSVNYGTVYKNIFTMNKVDEGYRAWLLFNNNRIWDTVASGQTFLSLEDTYSGMPASMTVVVYYR